MTRAHIAATDPKLDLVLERVVDVPPDLVWLAWTRPEHLVKWFTPAPWKTTSCEVDLRPGGLFKTVMQSPEGQEFPNVGCYLEVIENERLVWTNSLAAGFRPPSGDAIASCGDLIMTAVISLAPHGKGTRYTATALHASEEVSKRHAEMGFHDGWSTCLDQLVVVVKQM